MACRDGPLPRAHQLYAAQASGAGGTRCLHRAQPAGVDAPAANAGQWARNLLKVPRAAEKSDSTRSTLPGVRSDLSQSSSVLTCGSAPSAITRTEPSSRLLTSPDNPSSSAVPMVQ